MTWEYHEFRMKLPPLRQTILLAASERFPADDVRRTFWKRVETEVNESIQPWLDAGWQPATEIGPRCICYQIDWKIGSRWQVPFYDPMFYIEFFLGILLLFLSQGWGGFPSSGKHRTKEKFSVTLTQFRVGMRCKPDESSQTA
jgi:hypothetical protein